MLASCMELMGMLPPSTMVAALSLMMLATPPLTSMVATPMLMLPSCMEIMAMRPHSTMVCSCPYTDVAVYSSPGHPYADGARYPTWDKFFYFFCVS